MQHAYAVTQWKERMSKVIRSRYSKEEFSNKALDEYLESKISQNLKDEKVHIVNNYTNKTSSMTLLKLIDTVEANGLICAGGGCIFLPHGEKRNILIEFIQWVMAGRDNAKAKRRLYKKGTDEWATEDRNQLVFKLIINMLYGCFGYAGFTMFNIFIAECITTQGRHIISSAINSIESFLGDSLFYENEDDFYNMIMNVRIDYKETIKEKSYTELFEEMYNHIPKSGMLYEVVTQRYLSKCQFVCSDRFRYHMEGIFSRMTEEELTFFYYKNNIVPFTRLPSISTGLSDLINANGVLNFCELKSYSNETSKTIIKWLSDRYTTFVEYNYPIFDRIHKAMYFDKANSLYSDTDSAFVSLDQYIRTGREVSKLEISIDQRDLTITLANIALTLLGGLTNRSLNKLNTSMNVKGEFADIVIMKNEYFFLRIMFTDVKKRYLALALLQEGDFLNDGKGKFEISGFDFKKVAVKPYIKKIYNGICQEDILLSDRIRPLEIFKKLIALKKSIEESIRCGNMEFFNQANVKTIRNYKIPYSQQGICGVTLWNALCPNNTIELPTDVNIVPIKKMTFPAPSKSSSSRAMVKLPEDYKQIRAYSEKYPEAYSSLRRNIYLNDNELVRHMNLTSLAIPKNLDYQLPEYIMELIDISSIINKTLNLFLPVATHIGMKSLPYSTTSAHLSNIIEI